MSSSTFIIKCNCNIFICPNLKSVLSSIIVPVYIICLYWYDVINCKEQLKGKGLKTYLAESFYIVT